MAQRDWSKNLTTSQPEYYFPYGNSPASNTSGGLYGARDNSPQMRSPGSITYSGIGGSFSRGANPNVGGIDPKTGRRIEADTGLGGTWMSGQGGPQITDLPGYIGMKEQQQSGSNFSDYQNKLSSLLGETKQNRYQQQLDELLADPSRIQKTAGYQFDVEQGNQAINRSAAARGQLGSGGVLAELAKYGQGLASKEYGSQLSRLASLSEAERQNTGRDIDRMTGLVKGAQQFGLSSGYYDPEQYTRNLGIGR